ncbi:hypothetical protein OJ252_3175 [Cryptosporidium canis]|uniref:Uncharacterized protein n=1 Tax=Cryptosporidium canis TaxID=195482 RepID=A0ABQ8P340_9CRYT|nr:hypothetical protein OJ252_3175 [Cryptosporidium canis]
MISSSSVNSRAEELSKILKDEQEWLRTRRESRSTLIIVSLELPVKIVRLDGPESGIETGRDLVCCGVGSQDHSCLSGCEERRRLRFGLKSSQHSLMRTLHGHRNELARTVRFIGWPGIHVEREDEKEEIRELLESIDCVPVFPPETEFESFNEFCQLFMWPLFHNVLNPEELSNAPFDHEQWRRYHQMNMLWSSVITPIVSPEHMDMTNASLDSELHKLETIVRIGHVHIQCDDILQNIALNKEILNRSQGIRDKYKGHYIFVSIDRLDQLSGLQLKLRAFDNFLQNYPYIKAEQPVVLIQYIFPTNTLTIEKRDKLIQSLVSLSNEINQRHSSSESFGNPVIELKYGPVTQEEKYSLFLSGDCLFDTSVRDGLNLNPFEYIICKDDSLTPLNSTGVSAVGGGFRSSGRGSLSSSSSSSFSGSSSSENGESSGNDERLRSSGRTVLGRGNTVLSGPFCRLRDPSDLPQPLEHDERGGDPGQGCLLPKGHLPGEETPLEHGQGVSFVPQHGQLGQGVHHGLVHSIREKEEGDAPLLQYNLWDRAVPQGHPDQPELPAPESQPALPGVQEGREVRQRTPAVPPRQRGDPHS